MNDDQRGREFKNRKYCTLREIRYHNTVPEIKYINLKKNCIRFKFFINWVINTPINYFDECWKRNDKITNDITSDQISGGTRNVQRTLGENRFIALNNFFFPEKFM